MKWCCHTGAETFGKCQAREVWLCQVEMSMPVPQDTSRRISIIRMVRQVRANKASITVAISCQPADTGCIGLHPLFLSTVNEVSKRSEPKHQETLAVDRLSR